ncbi:protein of unknown function [Acetanaerobacterium elongatum]|uniref:Uncharacterized protein n=1 Tax=Acetanaerobacterium elongatum TaxID=258515 RepID=A0A1H0E7I3_9FIRM|nr:protein of unknown function [Acetanaerobacterium elongatum]
MTDKVRKQILAIRDTGLTNMFAVSTVQRIANDMGFYKLVVYLEKTQGICPFHPNWRSIIDTFFGRMFGTFMPVYFSELS